jgi:hypothetical protein
MASDVTKSHNVS